ncbi:SDR family NAD(P)-dependent oxidoreductase [Aquirufa antheringensis]|uniref:SDR family NAD(P)-dependent oxidoreductase n=1 Tax=Aquirufa antheringensis TaxID=2516559 RepID=UPI001032B6D6|nr:SDR family oxidoreductase [Aquirufa antheringensis]TBH71742.1 SDR family oxidoreductase [Aquirufa antheringensis]
MDTVLITGSTSSIGEEIAIFLSKKYRIILAGRDSFKLHNLLDRLHGDTHLIWVCNFETDNVVDSLLKFLSESPFKPNHFLHLGGDFNVSPIRLQKTEKIVRSFKINVISAIEMLSILCRKEYKQHIKNILFFSSISAIRGKAGFSVYSAAKSSLIGLTKSLSIELNPIKVNCLVLGPIMTSATNEILNVNFDDLNSHIPLGIATPSVLNDWLEFLIEKNNWMTGQELIIDGGATIL